MARRMVKQRPDRSTGEALTWFFDHGFRRFGFNAMPIVRAAGWVVFDQLHVTKAATGTREELARQGMLTRCVRLEKAPRGGWSWAWTHDPLAAVNLNRSLPRPPRPPAPRGRPRDGRGPARDDPRLRPAGGRPMSFYYPT